MSSVSSFLYSVKQGFKNIYRNRMFSLASIGTIATCIFMFGIFYFILTNFQHIIQNAENNVGITILFEEGITGSQRNEIETAIKKRPELSEIRYISAEEAWDKFCSESFENQDALYDSFGKDNPLANSDSFEVKLNDLTKQESFVTFAEGLTGVRQVNSAETTVKTLSSFNILVGYISGAVIMILLSIAIFLISTTVTMGISVRKNEIAIMRLVGATDFFIRAPFIVEGIVIGFIGTIIPIGILYAIYNSVVEYIGRRFQVLQNLLDFLEINTVFKTLIPIVLAIGLGIGFIGSFFTVRKHLKV